MRRLITAIAIAALCLTGNAAETNTEYNTAGDAPQLFGKKKKKKLEDENRKLAAELDSLRALVDQFYELMDAQRSAEDESSGEEAADNGIIGAGLAPEDYTPEVTDSLLSIWYLHRNMNGNDEAGDYNMDSVRFTSNVPDKVLIERLGAMNSYITLPFNETVRNYILLYSEKMPSKMANMLGISKYYFPIFEETFNRYGLPEELKFMAVIESALNPTAVSRAGAKGMWQFMYNTAKIYGLTINSYVDERLDPVKAADAAARYLQDSYGIFGDWNLAISSYNCGAGNVNKAIRRSGGSRDFWDIYDYLPRETRGYVPAFVGAMYAFKYYKEHALVPTAIEMPEHVDTFHIHKMLHFQQINEVVGVPVQTLRDLNPQYIHDIIPGNDKPYILRLPYSYTTSFIAMEDSVYRHKARELFNPTTLENIKNGVSSSQERIVYKVKSGDYLGRIATKYHVGINDIKKWNNLRNNNLRVGQRLVIYRRSSKKAMPAPKAAEPVKATEPVRNTKPAAVQTPKDTAANTVSDTSSVKAVSDTSSVKAVGDSTSIQATRDTTTVTFDTTAVKASVTEDTKGVTADTTEPAGPEFITYTVRKGDTLYGIIKKYPGVTVNELLELNGMKSAKALKYGMKIRIPKR